jgi:hypothetical protein
MPTCTMLPDAVDKVRDDCTGLMTRSREYVFWSTVLLTGNPVLPPLDPQKLVLFSF